MTFSKRVAEQYNLETQNLYRLLQEVDYQEETPTYNFVRVSGLLTGESKFEDHETLPSVDDEHSYVLIVQSFNYGQSYSGLYFVNHDPTGRTRVIYVSDVYTPDSAATLLEWMMDGRAMFFEDAQTAVRTIADLANSPD